ncbi:MAG: Hsp70 protein that interacts with Zuo1p [Trizodia sp. TS-e1964]|nr:MAG: Hsp70 protein that interacts with Zuo1p [Trizodia sp. TS-e1964]
MVQDGARTEAVVPFQRIAIGLSFGNSNSSIAFTSADGKAEVIANEEGDRQIPSILSYVDGEEYHGMQAKLHLVRNSKNTVAYFRDYLGKDFKSIDPTPCHASAHPQDRDSVVTFSVHDTTSGTSTPLSVSEVTTRHLRRLASSASDFLGKTVSSAVITVPTDFTAAQRNTLTDAAKNAQIEVLQFISEPVAALLAYDAKPDSKVSDRMILVGDFGGTRSDVSVIASRGGMYSTLATAHDYTLGGSQLDQVLVDHFAKDFIKWNKTDPRDYPRSLAKLKLESEATKKTLSLGSSATISIESLAEGNDYNATINRTRYELLADKIFSGFTRLLERAVSKAGLDPLDIDEVILSGGTSHTPKIARLVQALFPPTTEILSPSTSATAINPSELAARGAAIQASLIQEFETEDIVQSTHPMVTVTPHLTQAIGVLVISSDPSSGVFRPLLAAETALPARRTAQFNISKDGGDVLIKLCEGSREIKVSKPLPKSKDAINAKHNGGDDDGSDSETDVEDDLEAREKIWKVGKVLAEAAIKGVSAGGKVEVMANVAEDLALTMTAREVNGKGGVRGIDFTFRAVRSVMRHDNLEFFQDMFLEANAHTVEALTTGERFIFTQDPENIKAILATQFQDYGKGPRFRAEWKDFLGNSIFTTDLDQWHNERQLIRPQFIKDRVSDLHTFEHHVAVLLDLIDKKEGMELDLGTFFFRYTLDVSTHFLMGKSVNSLQNEHAEFAKAFAEVQRVQNIMTRAGPLLPLVPRRSFNAGLAVINDFVGPFIDRTLELSPEELTSRAKSDSGYTFLHAIAAYTRDRQHIRDQLVAILLASRDTTACTLSWAFYELARNPSILAKLRDEILLTVGPDRHPTYADLKGMKFLKHTINETLRIYPVIPYNMRVALHDTTLPRGGGPDGLQPMGVLKDTPIGYATINMQRRKDLYPFDDVEIFNPERWNSWTPKSWTYIPFNGGPRICVGQQFALTEMAYTIVRILQRYEAIDLIANHPDQIIKAEIVLQPGAGVHVKFRPHAI